MAMVGSMSLNESSVYQLLGWVPPDNYLLPGGDTIRISQVGPACIQTQFITEGERFKQTEVVDFFPELAPVIVSIEEVRDRVYRRVGDDHAIFHPKSSRFEAILADLAGVAIPKTRSVW